MVEFLSGKQHGQKAPIRGVFSVGAGETSVRVACAKFKAKIRPVLDLFLGGNGILEQRTIPQRRFYNY